MNRAELRAVLIRLLVDDEQRAKTMRGAGKSYAAIAEALDVSKTAAFYLVNGRRAKPKAPVIKRPWKPGDPIPQSLRLS